MLWVVVPVQAKVKEFFADFDNYPHQDGSSLDAGGINCATLRQAEALERLKDVEHMGAPG